MKKFSFKLQTVLNMKIQMENDAKNKLGQAIQKYENEKNTLQRFIKQSDDSMEEMRNAFKKEINIVGIRGYSTYISHLSKKIEVQQENVETANQNVNRQREKLVAILKERKALDKLHDKKYELYLREQSLEEQKLIDEITSFKYNVNN